MALYDLSREEVIKICESLKFRADYLDHLEGSRAEESSWAQEAALIWRVIDKLDPWQFR